MLKEQVDPVAEGVERYVAGEHMETENVHIRKWGNVGEGYLGPAFIRRFRKGQVLYGSRRTYLKKVAVAEWDGVTANTTFVLEAVEGKLLQELLPWLMLSERFTQHSIQESKGSTNPYINFPDIAKFEFDFPPVDQQRRIAEILWSLDNNIQSWCATLLAIKKLRYAIVASYIKKFGTKTAILGDCLDEIQYGSSSKAILKEASGLAPMLRIPNVIGGKIDSSDLVWLNPTDANHKYRLMHGDLLIVRTNGNPDYVGRTAVYDSSMFEECLFASYLIRLRAKPDVLLPCFLHEMLQSVGIKKDIRMQVKSSAGNYNLNTQGIRNLRIPIPSKLQQQDLIDRLAHIDTASIITNRYLKAIRDLRLSILNFILTGGPS
jgi:restriction endonuclease S subunit